MSALTVLCSATPRVDGDTKPGGDLPYGIGELRDRYEIDWIVPRHGPVSRRVVPRVDGVVRRLSPGRRGWSLARAVRRRTSGPVLSVFEDARLAFARCQRRGAPRPHVMISCWLAQDVADRPDAAGSWRASLATVSAVCVYSANQPELLRTRLGIDGARIHVVPFGVDTGYYDSRHLVGAGGGDGVVAVGSDSRRDYATLFAAAERTGIPMTVACHPRNLVGLSVPPMVRIVRVFDEGYRELLHRADLVVTTTTAPAYPSGQSVVLEAMSMGTATITTDSAAMRDYVIEGETGALVPAGDAVALAGRLRELLGDRAQRAALARRAAEDVRRRFTLRRQWDAVARVIEGVTR